MKILYLKRGGSKTKGVRCLAMSFHNNFFLTFHPSGTFDNYWNINRSPNSWTRLVKYRGD